MEQKFPLLGQIFQLKIRNVGVPVKCSKFFGSTVSYSLWKFQLCASSRLKVTKLGSKNAFVQKPPIFMTIFSSWQKSGMRIIRTKFHQFLGSTVFYILSKFLPALDWKFQIFKAESAFDLKLIFITNFPIRQKSGMWVIWTQFSKILASTFFYKRCKFQVSACSRLKVPNFGSKKCFWASSQVDIYGNFPTLAKTKDASNSAEIFPFFRHNCLLSMGVVSSICMV